MMQKAAGEKTLDSLRQLEPRAGTRGGQGQGRREQGRIQITCEQCLECREVERKELNLCNKQKK